MISNNQKVRRALRVAALAASAAATAVFAVPAGAHAGTLKIGQAFPGSSAYEVTLLESSFLTCPSTTESTWTATPALVIGTDPGGMLVYVQPYTAAYCEN